MTVPAKTLQGLATLILFTGQASSTHPPSSEVKALLTATKSSAALRYLVAAAAGNS